MIIWRLEDCRSDIIGYHCFKSWDIQVDGNSVNCLGAWLLRWLPKGFGLPFLHALVAYLRTWNFPFTIPHPRLSSEHENSLPMGKPVARSEYLVVLREYKIEYYGRTEGLSHRLSLRPRTRASFLHALQHTIR